MFSLTRMNRRDVATDIVSTAAYSHAVPSVTRTRRGLNSFGQFRVKPPS